jgi:ferredoxin
MTERVPARITGKPSVRSLLNPTSLNLMKKESDMKVIVTENCMGDRRCNDLCPEVFEYDEDELKSIVKVDKVPAQYEALVRQAADECGADAIIVEDD